MKTFKKLVSFGLIALMLSFCFTPIAKAKDNEFTLLWSDYVGWVMWHYAKETGVLDRWATKYGVKIKVERMSYIPTVETFVAGRADACVMTNMECLDMPSSAGIDCSVIGMGDYSNDNDQVLARDGIDWHNIKGQTVYLSQFSVSHILLVQGLEENGLTERDVNIVNITEDEILTSFIPNPSMKVLVGWNPYAMKVAQLPGVKKIYGSAEIPGQILDLLVIPTKLLQTPSGQNFAKALIGAWYEVLSEISQRGPKADSAMARMAEKLGATLTEFKAQMSTTAMFYTPTSAVEYTKSQELQRNMDLVRNFCFDHGLLGESADSAGVVGILYPNGTVQGNPNNIKMRFDATFMQLAAEGKL